MMMMMTQSPKKEITSWFVIWVQTSSRSSVDAIIKGLVGLLEELGAPQSTQKCQKCLNEPRSTLT